MKTYQVKVESSVILTAEIEASSQEIAEEIAHEMDGSEFEELANSGEWNVYEVSEIKKQPATDRYSIRENRLTDDKTIFNICEINNPDIVATFHNRAYANCALKEMNNAFSA